MVTTAPVRLSYPLQRLAGVAGLLGATVLVVNAAKRAHLIPTSALTQLLAPMAEVFALALITALYLLCEGRIGWIGRVTFAVNYVALALLVGVEFAINLVFSRLSTDQVADLRAGPLGAALTVASVLFLLGSVGFAVTLAATAIPPRGGLALYALGSVPVALRAFVPEVVLDVSLVVLALGVVWLSLWLVGTRHAEN
ncbi:hypothetical protein Acy02nite_32990 [Actinoplanes cyaneus]|uniref:Uncharacterized protein n=1 Tax=Actinoplanes cyaneus TaxID=52696 RepID=A0A919IH63_9ACTN|nr:hypothetical protein [Actinoplanes cyaneus]MCW2140104.1 hypothetical protein [Actinoplanes cyaneus]GID65418.1 hypothetical protein Acy02nite_32990 [Actinoplanes cyaneus]